MRQRANKTQKIYRNLYERKLNEIKFTQKAVPLKITMARFFYVIKKMITFFVFKQIHNSFNSPSKQSNKRKRMAQQNILCGLYNIFYV